MITKSSTGKKIDLESKHTMSVAGGSLLLSKAGLLNGKNAATHWFHKEELIKGGGIYIDENYVKDDKYYTGKGASESIDMVLAVINEIGGPDLSKKTQLFIEYDPHPPVQAGMYEEASRDVKNMAQQLADATMTDTTEVRKSIAMMLYNGFTMLDITGLYQVFKELESFGYDMTFVAEHKGIIPSDMKLSYLADQSFDEVSEADILFIPGGSATAKIMQNKKAIDWVKKVDLQTENTTSVCTGSLVLAKASLLEGRNAACHWYAGRFLSDYDVHFSKEKYTKGGKYITGAGVSSGIDLALLIVKETIGNDVAEAIQLKIGCFPKPPHDSGSPEKSDKEVVAWLSKMFSSAEKRYVEAKELN